MHAELAQLTEETLRKMGFVSQAHVHPPEDDDDVVVVSIQARDASVLIGKKGRNLYALQHILRLLSRHTLLDTPRFVIDVNDYRAERRAFLKELAETVAQRVDDDSVSIELKPMNAFERRIIHMELADRPHVMTESTGQGPERRVVVRPADGVSA